MNVLVYEQCNKLYGVNIVLGGVTMRCLNVDTQECYHHAYTKISSQTIVSIISTTNSIDGYDTRNDKS